MTCGDRCSAISQGFEPCTWWLLFLSVWAERAIPEATALAALSANGAAAAKHPEITDSASALKASSAFLKAVKPLHGSLVGADNSWSDFGPIKIISHSHY